MNAVAYTPQSEAPDSEQSSYATLLVRVWSLVAYTDEHENGDETQPFGPRPEGLLIYTADGFVSARLMKPGRPAFHSADWHHGTQEEYRASGVVISPTAGPMKSTRRRQRSRIYHPFHSSRI
jgi:hypothetical protein